MVNKWNKNIYISSNNSSSICWNQRTNEKTKLNTNRPNRRQTIHTNK